MDPTQALGASTADGAVAATGEAAAGAAPVELADCTRAEQTERHYLDVINPLLTEAWKNESLETFADVLAWALARIIVHCENPHVMGHILKRIGHYTMTLADQEAAQKEADTAKQEGRIPH